MSGTQNTEFQEARKGQLTFTPLLLKRYALAMQQPTRLLTLEGPARSAKTSIAIEIIYRRAFNSPNKMHAICGQTLGTIENNLLNAEVIGLLETHPDVKRIGNRLYFKGADHQQKVIIMAGYLDADQWKKVVGGNIASVLVDEANLADMNFIRELFARKLSIVDPLIIFTLNGDDPNHPLYQEFINFGKMVGDVPASTRKLMEDFQMVHGIKPGFYYCHFKMQDNPFFQDHPEKLIEALSIYPVGSYYYMTKILGERGVPGDLIFRDYMNESLLVDVTATAKDFLGNPLPKLLIPIHHYTIGCDIGATQASNVFVLTGWAADNSWAIPVYVLPFKQCGYEEKRKRLFDFLDEILFTVKPRFELAPLTIYPAMIDGVFPDSAEQNFIIDLKTAIYNRYGIQVAPSYKATIKERIDMMIVGFSTGRIKFYNKLASNAYKAYGAAVWAKDHKNEIREDKNEEKNDIMDAVEYSLTPHMKALMANGR